MRDRIKLLCRSLGVSMSKVENDLGFAKGYLSKLNESTPNGTKLQKLADYFNVTVEYLLSGETTTQTRIPVYGRVAAGTPLEMIVDVDDWEEIDRRMTSSGDYFALRIKGDSMLPRIENGDVVIVRHQPTAENGDIVIATVNGDDATCKRLRKYRDGSIELVPFNPAYSPMFFSADEQQSNPVRIIGKVVELRARF